MPGDYSVLAPIYDKLGLGDFAATITPRLITYAQQNDWMGRRILNLGCGTGMSEKWLCSSGFSVMGVDSSADMLAQVPGKLDEKSQVLFKASQQDIRSLSGIDPIDMVLALDVMNELEGLRELEQAFTSIHKVMPAGKLFIFDMRTLEGITQDSAAGESLLVNDPDLVVMSRREYDYERQIATRRYLIFRRSGSSWQRQDANQVFRAYPIQGVAALLKRTNFTVNAVLTTDLAAFDPANSRAKRVVFVTQNG